MSAQHDPLPPPQGETVSRLARRFGLSRSTLLYYDRIGLLRPRRAGHGRYRRYSPDDATRLAQICRYRDAGVRLGDIRRILDSPDDSLAGVLERRLEELNAEVAHLREQQRFILGILQSDRHGDRIGVMNRARWIELLRAAGFADEDMRRWHVSFERHAPEKHQEFLEFLCIPDDDIVTIRSWAAR